MIPPDVTETHHAERDGVDDEGDEERFPRLLPNALAFAGIGFGRVAGISAPIANKFAVIDVHGSSLRGATPRPTLMAVLANGYSAPVSIDVELLSISDVSGCVRDVGDGGNAVFSRYYRAVR